MTLDLLGGLGGLTVAAWLVCALGATVAVATRG
jgi:hypothetical protein